MKARDLMLPVREVRPEDPAAELVDAFRDPSVRAVAVVTDVGELVGAFSDEDMLGAVLPSYVVDDEALAGVLEEEAGTHLARRLEGKRVKDLLDASRPSHSVVGPDDTLIEAAATMVRSGDPAILVVEEGRVLGVLPVDVLLPALLGQRR